MTQKTKTYLLLFLSAFPFTVMRNKFQYDSYFGDEVSVFLITWVMNYAGLAVVSALSYVIMVSWQSVFMDKGEDFKINNEIAVYCVACITLVTSVFALFIYNWGLYQHGS